MNVIFCVLSFCRKDHEKCEFEVHEVYAVDILISTGEGKGREMDARTTIYKKKDTVYNLKMKASRRKNLTVVKCVYPVLKCVY